MSDGRTVPTRLLVIAAVAPLLVGLALILFTWPSARSAPRDVPVGVVASSTQADVTTGKLTQDGGAFVTRSYGSRAAAVTAIEHREIDAAVVRTGPKPEVLVASAAGPALAMAVEPLLTSVAGSGAVVTDVVPTPRSDPKGTVVSQTVLPLTLAGELGAIMLALAVRPGWRQLLPVTVISAATGLIGVLVIDTWLDVLGPGTWWIVAGVLAYTVLAVGCVVLALHALLGRVGLPLAFLILVFLGNAFSGSSGAPELLPRPARHVGQWLPPGAGAQLLRDATFFHGHGFLHPTIVLGVYVVVGFAVVLVGGRLAEGRMAHGRHERDADTPAAVQPAAG